MGLFDFLKSESKGKAAFSSTDFPKLLEEIAREANSKKESEYSQFSAYSSLNSFTTFKKASHDDQREFLSFLYRYLLKDNKGSGNYWNATWYHAIRLFPFIFKITSLNDDDFLKAANFVKSFRSNSWQASFSPDLLFVEAMERKVRKSGLTPTLRNALQIMVNDITDYSTSDQRKANELILFLMQEDPNLEISEHDRWGKVLASFLKESKNNKVVWVPLFAHAKTQGSKSVPSQKWLKEATPMLEKIGKEQFVSKMEEWLLLIKQMMQEIHKAKNARFDFLRNENHEIIKALVWCCGLMNTPELLVQLDDYAAWAYKKLPGVGPLSAKTGTAAMFAFSLLPVKDGVSRLSKFKMKIKNNTILKSINKIIREVADKNNLPLESLEELSVPDFGIEAQQYSMTLGLGKVVYSLTDNTITWQRDGKIQKTIPADIKNEFGADLKTFKNTVREIDALIPVVKSRLEQSYLNQRQWTYSQWRSIYLDHPLASMIASKLIWHFSQPDLKIQGILLGETIVNVKGEAILEISEDTVVQLWHPIGFTSDQIVAWRNFLKQNQVVQPFKQAYREVYIVTDAEIRTDTYSNRFAAHVLRQHQFAALCRQRAWHYQLMGAWDSHNTPYLKLPQWQMTAEFYVNAEWNDNEGNTNGAGIFNYITADQVRFVRDSQAIAMQDVPALVFSEVMRDVDLFVGVTSIGNDPAWVDGGDNFQNTYWREYSFRDLTESAQIRSQVLQSLIPALKIAAQCSFDKKFLVVKGKLRTYKIHMGSGNILMEPDDQYLCIVPGGERLSKEKVFLPFEGDGLLSVIISKAFLLAADDKITDTTITRQINR